MRVAAFAGAVALSAVGWALAQDAAAPPPVAAPDRATVPAERPAARPETSEPPAAPTQRPQPQSQGRLIPPEEMPPTAPPPQTNDASTPAPVSGTLIPPAAEPPAPLGPPAPETLRESDFAYAACRLQLHHQGTEYREVPAITDPNQRDCGIARPIEVTKILPGITLEGGAVMRCDTARALAAWMDELVVPSASRLPDSPKVTSLALGTTYHCRGVVGNGTPQNLSEHAVGNAIDIAAFGFDNGARIEIAPPGDRGDLTVAFQNAVQGAACLFFTTVLGPGSNAAHDDHLHLDIKARRGGFRLCQ